MNDAWKTFRIDPRDDDWEPAAYNIRWSDGREYGRWRRVLRQHRHGLTVISRYTAPPGKAWKIVGKASELGEEVYLLEGHYYDARGRAVAGPGTYMFNAPGCDPWRDLLFAYAVDSLLQWKARRNYLGQPHRLSAGPWDSAPGSHARTRRDELALDAPAGMSAARHLSAGRALPRACSHCRG